MNKRTLAYLLLVPGTFFWGVNFHFAQISTTYMSPMAASAFRYFFGVAGMMILFPLINRESKLSEQFKAVYPKWFVMLLISLSGVFFFNYFFFKGLTMTSAVNGSLIIGLNPALTALFSLLIIRQPISVRQLTGIMISLVGLCVVISRGDWTVFMSLNLNRGDGYMLLASVLFAFHHVLIQRYVAHISAIIITVVTSSLALFLFLTLSMGEVLFQLNQGLPLTFWGAIAFMGLAGTTLSFYFWNRGVITIGAGKSAMFINLVPLFAVLSGFLFDKSLNIYQIIGGMLIAAGIYITLKKPIPGLKKKK
ncbi:MAG: DMT family transporter [Cyclobacteriaceae bacterium]|nr:DMT family transporter [Cyclobacteriaceae bacterium]